MRPTRTALALFVATLALAGCASGPPAPTAGQVVTQLAAKTTTARAAEVYTPATDPNHLMGRPGGYSSKANFRDSRVPELKPLEGVTVSWGPGVESGGSVEVYDDADQAEQRYKYVQGIAKAAPGMDVGYTYLRGQIILRVAGALTPDQAAGYEAALKGIAP